MISRLGAHTRWATEQDRTAATAPTRRGFRARFEREVDPDGVLTEQERTRRADSALRAHMMRLALRSAQTRRARDANTT